MRLIGVVPQCLSAVSVFFRGTGTTGMFVVNALPMAWCCYKCR